MAGIQPQGAISLGLGGISSMDTKDWAIFNNPAGLVNIQSLSGIVGYQTILDFSPFNSAAAGINIPNRSGTLALGISRFGDELFNTQTINFGFARKIGIMSLGIKTNVLQMNIDGFGKRSIFISEIGSLADLTPKLTLGTHIYNFTQSRVSPNTLEKIPTIIRLSVDYHPTDLLNIYTEIEKDVELNPNIKFGLAYQLIESLTLRTGISTALGSHSFGSRLIIKRFQIDYAVLANRGIGTQHSFGLTYKMAQ